MLAISFPSSGRLLVVASFHTLITCRLLYSLFLFATKHQTNTGRVENSEQDEGYSLKLWSVASWFLVLPVLATWCLGQDWVSSLNLAYRIRAIACVQWGCFTNFDSAQISALIFGKIYTGLYHKLLGYNTREALIGNLRKQGLIYYILWAIATITIYLYWIIFLSSKTR